MATRPISVVRGGGKKLKTELLGIREMQANVRDLVAAVANERGGSAKAQRAKEHLYIVVGEAAALVKDEFTRRALAQRWPRRVISSIFTFADPAKDKPRRTSALVGVNKRRSMVEWYPAKSKSLRAKSLVIPTPLGSAYGSKGGKIAMSLASMYESGTSVMKARPAFGPAVRSVRGAVFARLTAGYKTVIELFNDQKRPS